MSADVPGLHRLRRELEDWLRVKDVDQWKPGEVRPHDIAAQIARREWYVLRDADLGLVAALRILRSDPASWGDDPTPAVYVHGLMVSRRKAGHGLGSSLLRWAGDRGRASRARFLRLDCGESNEVLRAFYRDLGFREVGRRDFTDGLFSVTLFEKVL
ncbi:GNAT family N-acetyltransferase [Saccharopolyspora sp. NPDC047091]|uniref:GNAT family N-acetyltransferase n=1 Tax=Saccharopolyspora sp. NPDC047091 TaxID=3155924 RepID=UPI0033ECCAE7